MSKREYKIIEIGGRKLIAPIIMTMATKRKKKAQCQVCKDDINVGETYFYDGSFYCIGCVCVEGDPEPIIEKETGSKAKYSECERCSGSGYATAVCDGCDGNPDEYFGEESVCPDCAGDGFFEKRCPECIGNGKVEVPD